MNKDISLSLFPSWALFAVLSAFFAALTALFGKLGVTGINSNLATLIRTIIIFFVIVGIISLRSEWQKLSTISINSWIFLTLSGIATGLSWLCYYHALQLGPITKVAPIDKLSVAIAILFGVIFLGEKLTWSIVLGGLLIISGTLILIAL